MKIVFNSDVLISAGVVGSRDASGLDSGFLKLLAAAAELNITVALPETAAMEVERKQVEAIEGRRTKIQQNAEFLRSFGIEVKEFDLSQLVVAQGLMEAFESQGVVAEIHRPTLEDYEDAHKRACAHLPPRPSGESDEMRDLVIWAMSLRIARAEGDGVILLSRDKVHHDPETDAEVRSANLERFKEFDDALTFLGQYRPGAKSLFDMITTAWPFLKREGLPVSDTVNIKNVTAKRYRWTMAEKVFVDAYVELADDGGSPVEADAIVVLTQSELESVDLSNIRVNGQPWKEKVLHAEVHVPFQLEVSFPVKFGASDYQQRLSALKKVIGG
jgi:hypothetical protein